MKLVGIIARYLDLPPTAVPGVDTGPDRVACSTAVYLPEDVNCWQPVIFEAFLERAAIMEFDGKVDRHEAEGRAAADIRDLFNNGICSNE